jgi:YheO-like PAS domain
MSRRKSAPAASSKASDRKVRFDQLQQIAKGGAFEPFCEVVPHDLTHPKNAILAIYNAGDVSAWCAGASTSSWPGLSRPSAPYLVVQGTWMPGTSPGMTTSCKFADSVARTGDAAC